MARYRATIRRESEITVVFDFDGDLEEAEIVAEDCARDGEYDRQFEQVADLGYDSFEVEECEPVGEDVPTTPLGGAS